jgi:uncharacterized protein (DUF2336 family)
MRQFIVDNFPVDPVELDLTLGQIAQQAAHSVSLPAAEEPAMNLARQLAERQDLTSDIIVETLRRGETPLFEAMLGERIGVKPILARKLIYDSSGEGLVVACRAASIDRSSFVTLFMLMQRARTDPMTRDPYLMSKSLELFDRLSTDASKKMVERWTVDPEYIKAILKLQARRR